MALDPAAMHRRNATLDLPSPRIGGFNEPEPYSPRFFPTLPPSSSSSKFSPPRFTVNQSLFSRQWLQRTTFLALFSLFSVSVYILLVNGSSNLRPATIPQQIRSPFQAAMNTIVQSPDHPWRPTHKDVLASRPQITLTPEEELAALSGFIISLPDQNILPPSVDSSQPIDPQLILDFDTRTDAAEAELKRLVAATWENYPVVMYTKVPTLSLSSSPKKRFIDAPLLRLCVGSLLQSHVNSAPSWIPSICAQRPSLLISIGGPTLTYLSPFFIALLGRHRSQFCLCMGF